LSSHAVKPSSPRISRGMRVFSAGATIAAITQPVL
jgi:hypothetical protein